MTFYAVFPVCTAVVLFLHYVLFLGNFLGGLKPLQNHGHYTSGFIQQLELINKFLGGLSNVYCHFFVFNIFSAYATFLGKFPNVCHDVFLVKGEAAIKGRVLRVSYFTVS